MMVPKDIHSGPPGLWRYTHPITGVKFGGAFSLGRMVAMVEDYNKANNIDPIVGLYQKIIDYMCEQEPDWCMSTEPPTLAQRLKTFSQAAVDWAANGFKNVPHDVFEARKSICLQCHYWKGEMAFGYGGCGKCGCSGLKLFLPTQKCPDGRWGAINV